ncbi:MAG: efflux RND transporter permease subunit [Prevotellaceae bacterium]|jgi:hypothetical protein|nr:efflux RND transporter permease subunit [Prevotellaceae bacterium]
MLSRIKGINNITSSSGVGSGSVSIEFDKHVNIDMARFEVSAIIRQAWPHLPPGVGYPSISVSRSDDNAARPFLTYTVNAPATPVIIQQFAENSLRPKLAQIAGVNRIDVTGAMPVEWRLEYDYKQLESLGVTIADIQDAITYTRRAKSASCPEAIASGSYVLTVLADPTVAVKEATTICYNTVPTAMTATPTGGAGTMVSCQWYSGASSAAATTNITGATASVYSPSSLTTTTYYRAKVSQSAHGCSSTSTAVTKTVYKSFNSGSITHASGTVTVSNTDPGITITSLVDASGGDENITYQWRRTTTSSTTSTTLTGSTATYSIGNDPSNYSSLGTYTIMRYAHDGTCRTSWVPSGGIYTLKVIMGALNPDKNYTYYPQIWKYPVEIAACDDSFTVARNRIVVVIPTNNVKYFYYNWPYVDANKASMCIFPWRVPTYSDFNTLLNCASVSPTILNNDWRMPGYANSSSMDNVGTSGIYWSSTEYDSSPCVLLVPQ